MKFIKSYNEFLTAYQTTWPKGRYFFNQDGSVALFEQSEEDEEVFQWVCKNGKTLKNKGAIINKANVDKIKLAIKEDKSKEQEVEKSQEEKIKEMVREVVESSPKQDVSELEALEGFPSEVKEEILKELNDPDSRLTLSKVKVLLEKIVENL